MKQEAGPVARRRRKETSNDWLELLKYIVAAVVISLILRGFVVEIINVNGDSMYPTLQTNEKMLVDKLTYKIREPKRGDIIVCLFEGYPGAYVKRVIGIPGDRIEIRQGTVYVNGEPQEETYLSNEQRDLTDMDEKVIPAKSIFVMGDNRIISMDSRNSAVGMIEYNDIIGCVRALVWPLNSIRLIN